MYDRLIRYAARYNPHAVAVETTSGHVSYADLDRAIDQVAVQLAETIEPGGQAVVGIAVADIYLHLLLIVGCARIGVASTSLIEGMVPRMAALAGATTLIADNAATSPAILVDRDWITRCFARHDAVPRAVKVDPAATARVQLSSGTTGVPKACAISWALLESRLQHDSGSVRGSGRLLSLIGPASGSLQVFLRAWIQGRTIVIGAGDPAVLVRQLALLRPSDLLATPTQLAALIDALPADAPPLHDCTLYVAGSRAEPALRDRLTRRLSARISLAYASTEAGVVAAGLAPGLTEPGATGWITPWTELEVLGPDGEPVATGEIGRIRLRGSDVVSGYLNEAPFVDGWLDTGDLGRVDATGMLSVIGRVDEVMNLGGYKLAPEELEAAVAPLAGVDDVAAFSALDAAGIEQPWLAIVRGEALDEATIGPALAGWQLPPVRIAWIAQIPRTALGKVQRDVLRTAAVALLASERT